MEQVLLQLRGSEADEMFGREPPSFFNRRAVRVEADLWSAEVAPSGICSSSLQP